MEFSKELDFNDVNISEIVRLFNEYNVDELSIEEKGLSIEIKSELKQDVQYIQAQPALGQMPMADSMSVPAPVSSPIVADSTPVEEVVDNNYEEIPSPMVGTFYEAPSPGSPPFVKEGDSVTTSTTVCIVEAMKMMNEIKPDINGKIVKILVKNGDAVQPGQGLFLIDPS